MPNENKKPSLLLIFENLLQPLKTSYFYDVKNPNAPVANSLKIKKMMFLYTFQRYDYDECDVTVAKIVAAHVKLQMANNK